MNLQGSEARRKEAKPNLYCPDPRCLWMTGDGRRCPRHGGPVWTKEWAELARKISSGLLTEDAAHELMSAGVPLKIEGRK